MKKPIQIFKHGKHTAMSGQSFVFSESDLAATVAAYDPAKHEAPLVVGHPKHDDPAYGWVGKLSFVDGVVEAAPVQVDAAFAEMVESGKFKKISASFYAPDSPSNPVPGVYYIRHVGFLGAMAPAVKGLRNPSFAEAEEGIVEFGELDFGGYDEMTVAKLFRRMREWIIGSAGAEVADRVLPDYEITQLEQAATEEIIDDRQAQANTLPSPAFAAPPPKGDDMSAEQLAELGRLKTENATLKASQLAFAEAEKKSKSDARHAEHVAFAEGLIHHKDGCKLLPVNKAVTIATLDFMASQEQVIEFGEGEAKKPLLDAYKASLLAGVKLVDFGEVAGANADPVAGMEFAAPRGAEVNKEQLELHHKALAYMEQHQGVEYLNAVKAVGGK